jgi:hypothetical protein
MLGHDSLSGRCGVFEMVILSTFCAVGVAFMVYVLIGTQRDLNRAQKGADTQGQKSSSRPW